MFSVLSVVKYSMVPNGKSLRGLKIYSWEACGKCRGEITIRGGSMVNAGVNSSVRGSEGLKAAVAAFVFLGRVLVEHEAHVAESKAVAEEGAGLEDGTNMPDVGLADFGSRGAG